MGCFYDKYSNGTKEVFKNEVKAENNNQIIKPEQKKTYNGPKQIPPEAIVGLVFGILWLFGLGAIVAIILGSISLKKIDEQPDRWKGIKISHVVILIGVAGIFIPLLFKYLAAFF